MGGTTSTHSLINANATALIWHALRGKPCRTYTSDVRIHVPATGLYTYPDLSVICGRVEHSLENPISVTNPRLLVEVLSRSTEAHDRGAKFAHYRSIPALQEYLLLSQDEPLAEVFFRKENGRWELTPVRGLEGVVPLQSLGIELPLAGIYDGVEFLPVVR